MKLKIPVILFMLGAFSLWGCYPAGPDYYEDLDVVITYHNPDYDFSVKSTFSMPDSIPKITGNLKEGDDPEFIPPEYADQILERIEINMNALGWDRVDIEDDPDVYLIPSSYETEYLYYWYDYWWWWWGDYYPGWGWGGYPGWGYPVYGSSYKTGTLLMTMIDPEEEGADGDPIVQWSGATNGLLSSKFSSTRVNNAIDKAFNQSPYLSTNQ